MQWELSQIQKLETQFGTPLYVFDEAAFAENYRELHTAMKSAWPGYEIAYSYKTNYTPYICRKVQELGGYAEVVSGFEYRIARSIGYPDNRIIFNGPCKGVEGVTAFLGGCLVNADSIDELSVYCDAARQHPQQCYGIGLRINLQIGQNFISRFGMAESEIPLALEMVGAVPNLKIRGLHCHISRCRGIEAWEKRTRFMLKLAQQYFPDGLDYIDLGSGMFGSMDPFFAAQFDKVPTYAEYAQVTAALFAQQYPGAEKPILFTEPGTTLINRFVSVIGRVEAIKNLPGKQIAVLNCSEHNLGETCTLKKLPIQVIPGGGDRREVSNLDLTGYTCLEQDVMYSGYTGQLGVGDYVVFGNTGGYSNVYKPPFIRPNCAMIAMGADGGVHCMKRAEVYEDLLQTYILDSK